MSKIVTAKIDPIRADKLRIGALAVPTPIVGLFSPKVESWAPLVCAPETLEYAEDQARKILANMDRLHQDELGSALLSMALTVLHYRRKEG